jgi:hypothetical protein
VFESEVTTAASHISADNMATSSTAVCNTSVSNAEINESKQALPHNQAPDISVKAFAEPITSSPLFTTIDKRPIYCVVEAPPCKSNDAIDKSVSILKNHWGDLGDDALVQGLEGRNVGSDTSLVSPNTSLCNKKQKKPIYKEQPASFNSAGMRTRAQKGFSKVVQ